MKICVHCFITRKVVVICWVPIIVLEISGFYPVLNTEHLLFISNFENLTLQMHVLETDKAKYGVFIVHLKL